MAALTMATPPAYRIVESFRPRVIQNGAPLAALLKFSIPHVTAGRRP
jgi:hypothetical protein